MADGLCRIPGTKQSFSKTDLLLQRCMCCAAVCARKYDARLFAFPCSYYDGLGHGNLTQQTMIEEGKMEDPNKDKKEEADQDEASQEDFGKGRDIKGKKEEDASLKEEQEAAENEDSKSD